MYMVKDYSAIKKNEVSLFLTTWMDLENIMLSEINQTEKDKYYMISHVEPKRKKERNKVIEKEIRLVVTKGRG